MKQSVTNSFYQLECCASFWLLDFIYMNICDENLNVDFIVACWITAKSAVVGVRRLLVPAPSIRGLSIRIYVDSVLIWPVDT